MKPGLPPLLAGLVALAAGAAGAQGVWRCGPEGTRFQDRPCAAGERLPPPAAPGRAAVQEAQDVVQRERLALQALAAERLQRHREAAARGLGPAAIRPRTTDPEAPPQRLRTPRAKPVPWTVTAPPRPPAA